MEKEKPEMVNGKWNMCCKQSKIHVASTQYISLGQQLVSRTVTGVVLTSQEVSDVRVIGLASVVSRSTLSRSTHA